jgi:hypothetical protein
MITIFCDFCKKNVTDQFLAKSSISLSIKRQFFRQEICRKYIKIHNIGPRSCKTCSDTTYVVLFWLVYSFNVELTYGKKTAPQKSFIASAAGWLKWLFGLALFRCRQGCQMAYFQTKNPDLGKFWRLLQRKMLVYYMAVWSILWLFGIFCDQLVYFMVIWYILVCCTKKNLATLVVDNLWVIAMTKLIERQREESLLQAGRSVTRNEKTTKIVTKFMQYVIYVKSMYIDPHPKCFLE